MAGHSRPKDGVASLAYVPAIHVFLSVVEKEGRKTWMPGTRPGMTAEFVAADECGKRPLPNP
jgi:hypothetical protein